MTFVVPNRAPARWPMIVAHRGAAHDAPENTLAAFRLAIEQGADAIEGDYWLTQDGQVICYHDESTGHMTAGLADWRIDATPAAKLRTLDVGRWKGECFAGERMPLLREVLAAIPLGVIKVIEIKCGPEIIPALCQVINASKKPAEELRIIGVDVEAIRAAKAAMPAVKAYWLVEFEHDAQADHLLPTADDVLATLARAGADGLDAEINSLTFPPDFVNRLREHGYEFHACTIDDPTAARRLIELGVDSITTNRPAWLREQLMTAAMPSQ